MGDTSIEWTRNSDGSKGKTWNPIRARNKETGGVGHYCEKVSPGCAGCYAERMQRRFKNKIRYNAADRDKVELFLDEDVLRDPLRWRKPTNVFPCSMTDLFGYFVPDEWIDRIMAVMSLTPHTYQATTKRAVRAYRYFGRSASEREARQDAIGEAGYADHEILFSGAEDCGEGFHYLEWPLPNLHLGVSVENQAEADKRIPLLLLTPAAVRWISAEPLIEPVNLYNHLDRPGLHDASQRVDWVVVGGESGPDARPFDLSWARSLVGQCRVAGVPCFVKQVGAVPMVSQDEWMKGGTVRLLSARNRKKVPEGFVPLHMSDGKGGDIEEFPEDLRVRLFPKGAGDE